MRQNNLSSILRTMLPPNRLHKIPLGVHQIKVNTMIDQIILAFLDSLWRTKIHSILLTNVFDLFPGAREADYCRVEFGEVGLKDAGGVAGRVAGYEEG